MVTIIFESHSTTVDNENNKASGHYDVELSATGQEQAKNLGKRHSQDTLDAIFCSDLKRSIDTAHSAFKDKNIPTFIDSRLRECDYGDHTRGPKDQVEADRVNRIYTPYPNGESISDRVNLVKSFLEEIATKYDNKTIMIIGHRATRIALEHLLNNKSLEEATSEPNQWQPGWHYIIKN